MEASPWWCPPGSRRIHWWPARWGASPAWGRTAMLALVLATGGAGRLIQLTGGSMGANMPEFRQCPVEEKIQKSWGRIAFVDLKASRRSTAPGGCAATWLAQHTHSSRDVRASIVHLGAHRHTGGGGGGGKGRIKMMMSLRMMMMMRRMTYG